VQMGFNNLAETVKTRTRGISVELEGASLLHSLVQFKCRGPKRRVA
jgi:hypothetical protein